jgi:hypothetical protein
VVDHCAPSDAERSCIKGSVQHACKDGSSLRVVIERKCFRFVAEREGFEPPIALRLCLISSQVHSTGLCHLSVVWKLSGATDAGPGGLHYSQIKTATLRLIAGSGLNTGSERRLRFGRARKKE